MREEEVTRLGVVDVERSLTTFDLDQELSGERIESRPQRRVEGERPVCVSMVAVWLLAASLVGALTLTLGLAAYAACTSLKS